MIPSIVYSFNLIYTGYFQLEKMNNMRYALPQPLKLSKIIAIFAIILTQLTWRKLQNVNFDPNDTMET